MNYLLRLLLLCVFVMVPTGGFGYYMAEYQTSWVVAHKTVSTMLMMGMGFIIGAGGTYLINHTLRPGRQRRL